MQERPESVWKEIRNHTFAAARIPGKRDGAGRLRKRLKSVRGSEVPCAGTTYKVDEADDELAAPLGDGVDDEGVEVDQIERYVDEEVLTLPEGADREEGLPIKHPGLVLV